MTINQDQLANLHPSFHPPKRENFETDEDFEEAMGFWQSRVGRVLGLARVNREALSSDSPTAAEP